MRVELLVDLPGPSIRRAGQIVELMDKQAQNLIDHHMARRAEASPAAEDVAAVVDAAAVAEAAEEARATKARKRSSSKRKSKKS